MVFAVKSQNMTDAETEINHNGAPDRFVMLSGGMDSAAMAYHMIEEQWDGSYGPHNKRPVAIYLDTTIGLSSQRLYVQMLADKYNWQLWTLRTHENFDEHTKDEGFYGNQQHAKIFNVLKGRQQSKLATVSGNPHFYFGTRRAESQARRDISRKKFNEGIGAWTHNPIADWSDQRVLEYLKNNEVPFNPNWDASIPKDCACGATAAREELLELEAEGYEVFVQRLRKLENEAPNGKRDSWAWSSFSENELRAKGALQDDGQTELADLTCSGNCSGRSSALSMKTDGGKQ